MQLAFGPGWAKLPVAEAARPNQRQALGPVGLDLKHEGRAFDLSMMDMIGLAKDAEEAGFESIWTNEDIGYDSFTVLSALAQHTRTVGLGTAIVNVYSRSAMQLAMATATLDEASRGRFMLGLSVGHHPWNDLGHGIPLVAPLARLREYVTFLRKALGGLPFTHGGPVFQGVDTQLAFDPWRDDLPIYVAGERPGIIKVAGEIADGLIINVVSDYYISNFAAEHLWASARAAGRDSSAVELTALVTCCIADDREVALAQARAMTVHRLRHSLKMLDTQPPHRHDEIRYLHDLMLDGQRERAADEVSEELATSIVAAGDAPDVVAAIRRYFAAGCTRVIAVAYPRSRDDVARTIAALSPTLDSKPQRDSTVRS
jgi:alkanesulfonate monooxygenase SsuD/methylene tetrahydromethanopterin reductase-like flavin-dependent oxidoreductase (luciferase family)